MSDDVIQGEAAQDEEELAELDEQQAETPEQPVPVELTSSVYDDFKEAFGEDQAALLQSKWGDRALQNEGLVEAVMEDHSSLDQIYTEHQAEDGGISTQGIAQAAEYLLENTEFNDLDELSAAYPELDAIILENYDERTQTVSAVGIYEALAYIGKRSGYKCWHEEQRT